MTFYKHIYHLVNYRLIIKDDNSYKYLNKNISFCPETLLPISTRPDYILTPSLIEISRMSLIKVQNIENFSIQNQFGMIEWPGKSNLTKLNLDNLIIIENRYFG